MSHIKHLNFLKYVLFGYLDAVQAPDMRLYKENVKIICRSKVPSGTWHDTKKKNSMHTWH